MKKRKIDKIKNKKNLRSEKKTKLGKEKKILLKPK